MKILLSRQPVTAGISVNSDFQFYSKDVYNDCDDNAEINHAVMVVGYIEGYGWKIKNSWGRSWGEDGYGWISEEKDCKICQMHSYPTEVNLESFGFDSKPAFPKIKC